MPMHLQYIQNETVCNFTVLVVCYWMYTEGCCDVEHQPAQAVIFSSLYRKGEKKMETEAT